MKSVRKRSQSISQSISQSAMSTAALLFAAVAMSCAVSCSGDSSFQLPPGATVATSAAPNGTGDVAAPGTAAPAVGSGGGDPAMAGMNDAASGNSNSSAAPVAGASSTSNVPAGTGGVDSGSADPIVPADPSGAGGAASTPPGSGGSGDAAGGAGPIDDGRVVLFDGTNLDAWESVTNAAPAPWRLLPADVAMEVIPGTGNIVTKQTFEDLFVHLEYWTPTYPSSVTGQRRGNSGVYLKRAYEMQVLDTFGLAPAIDTCGAVYGIRAPPVSACLQEEMWNTYEIEFQASRWDGTVKTEQAVMLSVHLNGQLIQENVPLDQDPTAAGIADAPGPQPLMLQDHDPDGRVRFRNIWVIPR